VVALAATTDPADLVAALVEAGVRVGMVEPFRRTPDDRYLRALAGDGNPGRSRP
jgi:hypothetical protein